MSKEVKFTDDELNTVKEMQKQYFDIQQALGQSAISKLRLAQQIESINQHEDNLTKQFGEIQENERKFLEDITKKYGEGTLDPNTGVYIAK